MAQNMMSRNERGNRSGRRGLALRFLACSTFLLILLALGQTLGAKPAAKSDSNSDLCLGCHGERSFTTKKGSRTVSLFVDSKKFAGSVHGPMGCTSCHADLAGADFPHPTPKKVVCGTCHDDEQKLYANSVHGKANARGNMVAPACVDCHGNHDILHVKDKNSAVAPLRIPYICGSCHRENAPAQKNLPLDQQSILENYTESIHGEGLMKKGLAVAANCASCHTPHNILPPSDANSSISRKNIAATCTKCHAEIEFVHRKIIKGALWEKESSVLPACVDCHQPHKVRKEFYTQGMANADCLGCHAKEGLKSVDGRNLTVHAFEVAGSVHANVACSQCHSEVNASKVRPCETIRTKVDCSKCHEAMGQEYSKGIHGMLYAKGDDNAPTCKECHGSHHILSKKDPGSRTYPTNVPALCANCHREGQKAAVRYKGTEHQIVSSYMESIHGKGLMQSGLTVTATCTNCHTAHRQLPKSDPNSTVNPANVPATCGTCHRGIMEQFNNSIHSANVTKTGEKLPVCDDCHSAHAIRRADQDDFKLSVMSTCGHCHEEVAKSYFDTYHGKVTKLGYTKTAKCYDCHGAHDILKVTDPNSHLSRANVVATCRKCHSDATRRFAGYLTHATHHDPKKYPILFFAFWGMTSLLVGTFIMGGVHTLLWLPRAFEMRRELKAEEAREAAEEAAEGGKHDVR
jgi:predicted CXXCH cytochrome family protein